MVEEKKNKKSKILIIVLIIALVLSLGYIAWDKKLKDYFVKEDKTKESQEGEENNSNQDLKNYNYEMKVYKSHLGNYEFEKNDYNEEVFSIKTEAEDAEGLTFEGDFILYNDNGLKLYNIETTESIDLELKKEEHNRYQLNLNNAGTQVVGILAKKYDKNQTIYSEYINLFTKEKLYKKNQNELYILDENYLYEAVYNEDMEADVKILKTNEEKVYKNLRFENAEHFVLCKDGFYVLQQELSYNRLFMNQNFEYIINHEVLLNEFFISEEKLYVLNDNNYLETYNNDGKVVSSLKLNGEVLHIFNDYYLTIENNKIYIRDYNGFSKELGDWEDYRYHSPISGYYNSNQLYNENEKNAGYYFIFEEKVDGLYGAGENPGIEYYFDPVTKEINSWDLEYVGGYAKPILYLYPEEKTEVTIDFVHEENLTTTYPKFKNNWEVTAKPNGDLYDKNGKYYYGLYWEEDSNHDIPFTTGFYVTKDNAIDFLEEKLTILGLNDKERNEFIMYWLPILEKNGQSIVYFEQTEERENYNKLLISPQPDSLLRIAIHVKKVNGIVNIPEQKLNTFERKGFTAVEWGGVIHN